MSALWLSLCWAPGGVRRTPSVDMTFKFNMLMSQGLMRLSPQVLYNFAPQTEGQSQGHYANVHWHIKWGWMIYVQIQFKAFQSFEN